MSSVHLLSTPRFTVLTAPSIAQSTSPAKLKITRRGRVVLTSMVTLILAVVFAGAASAFDATAVAANTSSSQQQFSHVVVSPGESLWQLATSLDSSADPRDLVTELMSLNALESTEIFAGQSLAVPLRYSDQLRVAPSLRS